MIAWLNSDAPFPPLASALTEPNGLLAAGADLSPRRIVEAYRRGIFPWYNEGQPVLWWSPDPRMVLFPEHFKVSHSLRKRIRRKEFEVRVDTAFESVATSCASVYRAGQYGTWITPGMLQAYNELHRAGYVHSVETWQGGRLVGGLYGVALGQVFFGESMFARATDASKVALAGLVSHMQSLGGGLIDCQQETAHLGSLGAEPIPRPVFAQYLERLIHSTEPPEGWRPGPVEIAL